MTYRERYAQIESIDELIRVAKEDVNIALVLGANPDRLKAIEDAMNERAREIEQEESDEVNEDGKIH